MLAANKKDGSVTKNIFFSSVFITITAMSAWVIGCYNQGAFSTMISTQYLVLFKVLLSLAVIAVVFRVGNPTAKTDAILMLSIVALHTVVTAKVMTLLIMSSVISTKLLVACILGVLPLVLLSPFIMLKLMPVISQLWKLVAGLVAAAIVVVLLAVACVDCLLEAVKYLVEMVVQWLGYAESMGASINEESSWAERVQGKRGQYVDLSSACLNKGIEMMKGASEDDKMKGSSTDPQTHHHNKEGGSDSDDDPDMSATV